MAAGGNWSTRSTIFRFLAFGTHTDLSQTIDNDFLLYMQKYVSSLITVSMLPTEAKEMKENAFKLLNEGYEKYVEHTQNRFGLRKKKEKSKKNEDKKPEKSKEEIQEQNLKAVKNITTNKDGSIKGFKNVRDLVKSVYSILDKKAK